MDDVASVISILNMKGGVGKTTLTSNLAVQLSEKGYKVLLIDLDPQFNATQSIFKYAYGNMEEYFRLKNELYTISLVLAEKSSGLAQMSAQGKNELDVIHKITETLHIIPGDLSLVVDTNSTSATRLKGFFNKYKIRNDYNFIIIDCPPTWGTITSIALELSNYYIIPTKLDEFSTIGITILATKLEEFIEARETPLYCLGVAYMMVLNSNSKIGIRKDQLVFKQEIENFFVNPFASYESMECRVKSKVIPFDTVIRSYIPISHKSSIYKNHLDKYPKLFISINNIISEIESRLKQPNFFNLEGDK